MGVHLMGIGRVLVTVLKWYCGGIGGYLVVLGGIAELAQAILRKRKHGLLLQKTHETL